jgi:LCP family protein required for cell wall assembly
MLLVAVTLTAVVLVAWLQGPVFVLRMLVQPDWLLALLVANAFVFAFRVHCVVDAYRLARAQRLAPPRGTFGGRAIAVAVLLALTAVPHVAAGYYDFRSYDLLTTVFAEDEPLDPGSLDAAPPVAVEPVAATASAPIAESAHGVAPPAAASVPGVTEPAPSQPPDKTAVNPNALEGRGRLNVLLVGGDAGPGRWGLRTDTMIVVSIDQKTKDAVLFSVPRNLAGVPMPASANTSLTEFPDILNALWGYATSHPEMYPDSGEPGATALKETISSLLGLELDYYAAVDLIGFVEVVDALGGVTVNVQSYVYDAGVSSAFEDEEWTPIDLAPGEHELDGRHALAYVRTRWATSDYDRMQRQRCLIRSLAAQASLGRLVKAFPKLASTMKEYVQTDIPLKALPDLVELVVGLDTKRMTAVSFVPPRFSTYADPEAIRAAVKEALRGELDDDAGVVALQDSCA